MILYFLLVCFVEIASFDKDFRDIPTNNWFTESKNDYKIGIIDTEPFLRLPQEIYNGTRVRSAMIGPSKNQADRDAGNALIQRVTQELGLNSIQTGYVSTALKK